MVLPAISGNLRQEVRYVNILYELGSISILGAYLQSHKTRKGNTVQFQAGIKTGWATMLLCE